MIREALARLNEAKKYQKMAFRALLPDNVGQHLDVIEREVSAMVSECCMNVIRKEVFGATQSKNNGDNDTVKPDGKVKKVEIN